MAGARLPASRAAGNQSAIVLIATIPREVVALSPTVSLYSHGSELYRSRTLSELSVMLGFDRTPSTVRSIAESPSPKASVQWLTYFDHCNSSSLQPNRPAQAAPCAHRGCRSPGTIFFVRKHYMRSSLPIVAIVTINAGADDTKDYPSPDRRFIAQVVRLPKAPYGSGESRIVLRSAEGRVLCSKDYPSDDGE